MKTLQKITVLFVLALFTCSFSFSQIVVSEKLDDPTNKIVQKLTKRAQVWIAGEWTVENNQYVWTKGYWTNKRPGYIFIQGYWEKKSGGWTWVPGNWKQISMKNWNAALHKQNYLSLSKAT